MQTTSFFTAQRERRPRCIDWKELHLMWQPPTPSTLPMIEQVGSKLASPPNSRSAARRKAILPSRGRDTTLARFGCPPPTNFLTCTLHSSHCYTATPNITPSLRGLDNCGELPGSSHPTRSRYPTGGCIFRLRAHPSNPQPSDITLPVPLVI